MVQTRCNIGDASVNPLHASSTHHPLSLQRRIRTLQAAMIRRKDPFASLKLTEVNTIRLIRLYGNEPCLYDVNSPHYGSRGCRNAATKRIADEMAVEGFGPKEVATKFKNLRNSYSQELKKVSDGEQFGENYTPKVYWFEAMDAYLRPFMYIRPVRNGSVSAQKIQNVHFEDNPENLDIKTEGSDEKCSIKAEITYDEATLDVNVDENSPEHNCFVTVTPDLPLTKPEGDSLDQLSEASLKTYDMYDHFGEFIAGALRKCGDQQAIVVANEITRIIMNHMSRSDVQ